MGPNLSYVKIYKLEDGTFQASLSQHWSTWDGTITIFTETDAGVQTEFSFDFPRNCQMTIDGLPAGKKYNLYVRTTMGQHRSQKMLIGRQIELHPPKLENISICSIARDKAKLTWSSPFQTPSEYWVGLHGLPSCDVQKEWFLLGDSSEHSISELVPGVQYKIGIRANIDGSQGICGFMNFTAGWSGDYIQRLIRNQSAKAVENHPGKNIITPRLLTTDGSGIGLYDFIEKCSGGLVLITGGAMSGKTTICNAIYKLCSQTSITIHVTRDRYYYINSDIFLPRLLNKRHDLALTESEKIELNAWLIENDDEVTFVFDDILEEDIPVRSDSPAELQATICIEPPPLYCQPLPSVAGSILLRKSFRRSTIFLTTAYPILSKIISHSVVAKIGCVAPDETETYLDSMDASKTEAWKQIHKHSPALCNSAKHHHAVLDLLHDEHRERILSPTWVQAKVYHDLYANPEMMKTRCESLGLLNEEMKRCPHSSQLLGFDEVEVSKWSAHERFIFAMHAVFFATHGRSFVILLQNCSDDKFLMLCAGCPDQKNLHEIFKLFLQDNWEEAKLNLERNLSFLYQQELPFHTRLGSDFFRDFLRATKKKNLEAKFFPEE